VGAYKYDAVFNESVQYHELRMTDWQLLNLIILMSSDGWSVATSLRVWEFCEYLFDVLVILGCVGEFIAEHTNLRTEEWRNSIGRQSLLLLTLGIGLGLFSLIKTNALSGQAIDSLGDKAQKATEKANQAATSADTANEKSVQAATAASGALEKSTSAEKSASAAVTVAGGARREAHSFEKDIVTAKTQAADAESHLADALQKAAAATAELQRVTAELTRLKSPRALTNTTQMVSILTPFKGTEYTFTSVASDEEAIALLRSVDAVLQQSGWKRGAPVGGFPAINVFGLDNPYSVPVALLNGVRISVDWPEDVSHQTPFQRLPPLVRAAVALNLSIVATLFPLEDGPQRVVEVAKGDSKTVRIVVGKKP
jgi:hypothetical protein